jgi:hypothetical protein
MRWPARPARSTSGQTLRSEEAEKTFGGPVEVAREGAVYTV